MRDLLIVAGFTIKEMVRRKSFIISLVIILVLIIVGFNIPNIINKVKGDSNWNSKILLVDNENIYQGYLEIVKQGDFNYEFEVANENLTDEDVRNLITIGDYDAGLIFEKSENGVNVKYVIESVASFGQIPGEVLQMFNTIYSSVQLSNLNLTEEQLNSLNSEFNVEVIETDENAAQGNQFVVMLLSMALFFAIHFFAYQVSSSITTEKTSRIMETLITSTKPRTIVLGKTIGAGIVGLIQVFVIGIVAIVSAKVFLPDGILDNILDLSNITPLLGVLIIIYFIFRIFLVCIFLCINRINSK